MVSVVEKNMMQFFDGLMQKVLRCYHAQQPELTDQSHHERFETILSTPASTSRMACHRLTKYLSTDAGVSTKLERELLLI
jgi:hypothetical protein